MSEDVVIGLEVHVQLATGRKLFSDCPAGFGAHPNDHTDPVSLGLPGTLPVPCRRAVELAARLALALDAHLAARSEFACKHYFYPDLPKNFQITQYEHPLATGGALHLGLRADAPLIPLQRLHLEEDAGRSLHDAMPDATLVDFDRAGTPLAEVVTEPVLTSPESAGEFLRSMRSLVRWLGVSEGNMEEGHLRCDANISLRDPQSGLPGPRVELKNLNSIKGVVDGLAYEIGRQRRARADGIAMSVETRGWDAARGRTYPMRDKEKAADYRYLPEPDLPPLRLDSAARERLGRELGEVPHAAAARLRRDFALDDEELAAIVSTPARVAWFEACVREGGRAEDVAQWVRGELARISARRDLPVEELGFPPEGMVGVLGLLAEGEIHAAQARLLVSDLIDSPGCPAERAVALGLHAITDRATLEAWIDEVLSGHPAQLEAYRAGKRTLRGFFVGRVVERSGGTADPKTVDQLLSPRLEEPR